MNLKEVKKIVWFDILLYALLFVILLISLFAILFIPSFDVKAVSQETNLTVTGGGVNGCSSSSGYCAITQDNQIFLRDIGTQYNGVLYGLTFQFQYNMNFASTYTLNIEANSNDFRNNSFVVNIWGRTSSNGTTYNVNSFTYTYVSNSKIQIIFQRNSSYDYYLVSLTGTPLTGISNYGIRRIYLTYDDGTQDNSGIIDNANQNTSDIIDNANQNSSDIIENQNTNNLALIDRINVMNNTLFAELSTMCPNRVDVNQFSNCIMNNANGGTYCESGASSINARAPRSGSINFTVSNAWGGILSDYIYVYEWSTYYLSFTSNLPAYDYVVKVAYFDGNKSYISQSDFNANTSSNFSETINTPGNVSYIRFHINTFRLGTYTIHSLLFNHNNAAFCEYGSHFNKIEEGANVVNGAIANSTLTITGKFDNLQDELESTNDFLMDDTDPTVDNNEISNVLGLVSVNDPLNYLVTLPITLLNKINVSLNTNQCTDFNIGSFGAITGGIDLSGYTFKFPCLDVGKYIGNSLWGTIDVIVGIGLLAVSLYKFYHMITNMLSLGAEEKASKISHYFTPMEFLQLILEGDIPGVTISQTRGSSDV